MTWIGIDDTDSPRGGCTTWALTELLRAASSVGADLIGYPRLVRLNPNVPGKTRGNAALSARFGRGQGTRRTIGRLPEGPIRSYARGRPLPVPTVDRLVEEGWRTVLASSRQGEPGTDPALVAVPRRLPSSLYWEAVCSQLAPARVRATLERCRAEIRFSGDDVGIVGAAASVSWPGAHPTWELLAYRNPARIGTTRRIDVAGLIRNEQRFRELILCRDRERRRVLITPHTDCPILFGLRAVRPGRLPRAAEDIPAEPVDRWLVFRTNQATGDHLAPSAVADLRPFDAARVFATVASEPEGHRGGHWQVRLRDRAGSEMDCLAFEPTKWLPPVIRQLRPGDRVQAWGGIGEQFPFRLEGIEIRKLAVERERDPNPSCPHCGRRMHSQGASRGFRCRACSVRSPPELRADRPAFRPLRVGAYHPTPSARRHLAVRAPEGGPGPFDPPRFRRRPRGHLYR